MKSQDLVEAIRHDFRGAPISESDKRMLEYAEKLTLTPSEMSAQDIERLRESGFDDGAVLRINLVASYYAYVNRIALGLGVSLEDFWTAS